MAELRETSPRARGRPRLLLIALSCIGNIPACAGKANRQASDEHTLEKHPRVRGEGRSSRALARTPSETSPRARGRQELWKKAGFVRRNIPACAGKAYFRESSNCLLQKHPRVRGEGVANRLTDVLNEETSPRARGRLFCFLFSLKGARNIPACAGKARP